MPWKLLGAGVDAHGEPHAVRAGDKSARYTPVTRQTREQWIYRACCGVRARVACAACWCNTGVCMVQASGGRLRMMSEIRITNRQILSIHLSKPRFLVENDRIQTALRDLGGVALSRASARCVMFHVTSAVKRARDTRRPFRFPAALHVGCKG